MTAGLYDGLRHQLRGALSGLVGSDEPDAVPATVMHSALQQALSAALVAMVEDRCRWAEEAREQLLRAETAGRMALEEVGAPAALLATFRAAETAEREAMPFLRLGEAAAAAAEWLRGGHFDFDYLEESAAVVGEAQRRLEEEVLAARAHGDPTPVAAARGDLCSLLEAQLLRLHSDDAADAAQQRAAELREAVEDRAAVVRRLQVTAERPSLAAALSGDTSAPADELVSAILTLQRVVTGARETARRCVQQAEEPVAGCGAVDGVAACMPALTACCAAAYDKTRHLSEAEGLAVWCTQWRAEVAELLRLERTREDLHSGALESRLRHADDAVLKAALELDRAKRRAEPVGPEREASLAAAKQEQYASLVSTVAALGAPPEVQALLPLCLPEELRRIWCSSEESDGGAAVSVPDSCERTGRQKNGRGPAASEAVRGLLAEVELLLRLQHRNVEAVQQLSAAGGLLCYRTAAAGKRLRRWFAEEEPSDGHIREVVRGFLHALAHLEAHGVVHGRVRPSVLRVVEEEEEGRGRAVLCDLRLGRGSRTDCDGDGEGGWEERLPEAGEPDMQALGRSLLSVLSDKGVGDDMEACFNELASGRLTAGDALKLEVLRRRAMREKRAQCVICFMQAAVSASVVCSKGHLYCKADFEDALRNTPAESKDRIGGRLLCQCEGCDAEPFGLAAVARVVDPDIAKQYEAQIHLAQRTEGREEGARVVEQRQHESEVEAAVLRIQEMLNLACSRCGQVFNDWTHCAAVTCVKCSSGFCAFCMEDCGTDAHQHVYWCRLNPNRGQSVDAARAQFSVAHRQLRQERITAYLRELRPIVVDKLDRRIGGALKADGLHLRV